MSKKPKNKAAKKTAKTPSPSATTANTAEVTITPAEGADAPAAPEDPNQAYEPTVSEERAIRGGACSEDIAKVLQHHRCKLVATIEPPERIGAEHSGRIMLEATVRILSLD